MGVASERASAAERQAGNKRLAAFYGLAALFGLLFTAMLSLVVPVLPVAVSGWFQAEKLGVHQFHETVAAIMLWSVLIGLFFQFFRPAGQVGAMQQSLVVLLSINGAIVLGGFSFPPMLVFLALSLIVAALHPVRGRLIRATGVDWRLLSLAIVAAAPLLLYANEQIGLQRLGNPGDAHAEVGHWVLMAGYAFAVVLLSVVASLRPPGWRVPTWSAGILALLLGLASIVMPAQPSSLGALAGGLAMVWGVLFIVAGEVTFSGSSESSRAS